MGRYLNSETLMAIDAPPTTDTAPWRGEGRPHVCTSYVREWARAALSVRHGMGMVSAIEPPSYANIGRKTACTEDVT